MGGEEGAGITNFLLLSLGYKSYQETLGNSKKKQQPLSWRAVYLGN